MNADHRQKHLASICRWSGRPQRSGAVRHALEAWFHEVKRARWLQSSDIKRSYATASNVKADRVVFNIKGNAYRLVVSVDFEKGIVWIEWIGDHTDYNRIDVTKVIYGCSSQTDQD